jgi:tetratricopeptide (TPR) repeat protein
MQKTGPAVLHALIGTGCWILVLLHCALPETRSCDTLIDMGDAAYARFDNIHALDCFRRAFGTCPGRYEAVMKMTRALIDEGEDRKAGDGAESLFTAGLRYADTLRRRYPDSGQGYFLTAVAAANIAQIKTGMKRVQFAMLIDGNIRKSIAFSPGFAPAFVVLGAYCREVAAANPVLKMLVRMFFGWVPLGTFAESEQTLRQALRLDPGNVYAHLELGRTYLAMGRKADAIAILKQMQGLPDAWHMDTKLKKQGRQTLRRLRE